MEATLAVLNDLVARGVIEKYGIGGAVGAIFWVEPFDTIDLERVSRLLNEAPVDRQVVSELIKRFSLEESWATFTRRYPEYS